MSCAKTAKVIEMLFWVWTQVGISKHALDRGCMLALPGKYE